MLLNLLNFCKKKEGEHNICSNDRNSMFKSRKSLGYHATWLHNECCVRFSKLKFRPSAGFSAWFRDHTGSGGPGFRTKGATACATFALPLSYLWQELLPFSAQQMPLHCTQKTVQGTVSRGSEEKIYIGANLKKLCTHLYSLHWNFGKDLGCTTVFT